jgi:hypothetical protein
MMPGMTKHLHTAPPASVEQLAAPPMTGSGQFDTIDAGKLIGKAVGDALARALPGLLAQELGPLLAQIAQPRMCATCLAKRIPWEKTNREAVETAMAAAQAAAASGGPADFALYLPERLAAAGVPAVNLSVTAEQGTEKCAEHITGIQGGSAPLLAATTFVPPGALGQPAR